MTNFDEQPTNELTLDLWRQGTPATTAPSRPATRSPACACAGTARLAQGSAAAAAALRPLLSVGLPGLGRSR